MTKISEDLARQQYGKHTIDASYELTQQQLPQLLCASQNDHFHHGCHLFLLNSANIKRRWIELKKSHVRFALKICIQLHDVLLGATCVSDTKTASYNFT